MSPLPNAAPKFRKRKRKAKAKKAAQRQQRPRPISDKRLAKLGGKMPHRTIVAKPRPKAETERAHGSAERREWTKRQPCIVPGCGRVPCDAAHLINGGKGRKADAKWTVPFCSSNPAMGYVGHHDQYDNAKRSFWAAHFPNNERAEIACAVEARWQAECGREGSFE